MTNVDSYDNSISWSEQESIRVSASLVAHDGHRLHLRGAERTEAIRIMSELGLTPDVMAHRLCITLTTLQRAANRAKIQFPQVDQRRWMLVNKLGDLGGLSAHHRGKRKS